jgi:hypothetical protein
MAPNVLLGRLISERVMTLIESMMAGSEICSVDEMLRDLAGRQATRQCWPA